MRILLSTSNKGKVKELQNILGEDFELLLKSDFDLQDFDVVEDGESLEENAYKKAKALFDIVKIPVLSDDTGLFVNALNGQPGVYSARYAGENATYEDNNKKLLKELDTENDRSAYFETVICFIDNEGNEHFSKGRLDGKIAQNIQGADGFGYDPIFIFDGDKSLAEISQNEKNKISHRSKALENLKNLLEKIKKD